MNRLKAKIETVGASIALAAIAAAAATAAILFSSVALFMWVQQRYDTVIACVSLAAIYSFIAFFSLVAAYLRRRKLERETSQAAAASANPRGLSDPDFILSFFDGFRSLGAKRAVSIFALVASHGPCHFGLQEDTSLFRKAGNQDLNGRSSLGGHQKLGGRNQKMTAMATASMTMAERKGAQFDSSIMDFMAISGSSGEHRARRTETWSEESQKTLIQRKKIGSAAFFSAEIQKLSCYDQGRSPNRF